MNQEFKLRWIEALLSGKYKQGQERLRTIDNEFCCLGVACDLYDPECWTQTAIGSYSFNSEDGYIPDDIAKDLGLDDAQQEELVQLNDAGESFKEIAQYIKENF